MILYIIETLLKIQRSLYLRKSFYILCKYKKLQDMTDLYDKSRYENLVEKINAIGEMTYRIKNWRKYK